MKTKTKTSKILLEIKLLSLINLKTNCCLCYKHENKTLSEELQDYKVKTVFETKRLQDSI